MFPDLGEVALCKRSPMRHTPFWYEYIAHTRAICSRSAHYVGCVGPSVVAGPTTVDTLVGNIGPCPIGCQSLPFVVTAGLLVSRARSWGGWLCDLEGPGVGAGLLVGG